MRVTINGTEVRYKPGIVLHEKLSEDLDTGLLIIPQTEEMTIEPMDEVAFSRLSPLFSKQMLVSDIKRTTTRHTGTKKYTYILGLVSPTIQLQRIVLPNRSVTQPLTGTKTDIYTVLSQYVSMYSDFTISSALQTLTTDVDCPEFQWNRPTLFEVCNDLLSEVDAVVTFTTGSFTQITYLDLNREGNEITDSFAETELTQSIQEYANKLETEIENAVVGTRNTRCIQWIALKTDSDAIITTDNFKLILEKPIYKINSITQAWADGSTVYKTADVTARVVEKTAYDLLLPSNSTGVVTSDYKRGNYYYEKGGNTIDGLSYHEDTWLGITSLRAVVNVFNDIASASLTNSECLEFLFKVDYQAQETVKLISNKRHNTANNSTLINNQDTSFVDFGAFARKQQQTVNRLGNSVLTLTGKVTTLPAFGDYIGDYKLAEREYKIYDDRFNFKGVCAKNYVLKDLFTGIKSERRFTKIASGSEALESNHIEEINLNLSNTNATTAAALEAYLMYFGQADEGIEVVKFTTDSNDPVLVAPSAYWTLKSLLLTWKMYDNYNAGISSESSYEFSGTTIGVKNAPYVDDNGNFTKYSYSLYKSITNNSFAASTWSSALSIARRYPLYFTTSLTFNDLVFSDTDIYRYKDNRETTVETKQFNITSDSDVFAGNLFFSNSSLVYTGTTDVTRYVAYSTTETYVEGDQVKKGTIAALANLTVSRNSNYYKVYSPDSSIDITTFASWCICDSSGNIYLANNGNDEYIYLNKEA